MKRRQILAVAAILVAAPLFAGAADLPERCRLVPVNGNCKALIERVYFDVGAKKCRTYFYDGCGPVVPFEAMEDCEALCETGADLRLGGVRRVAGRPFATVNLEYPKEWTGRPEFSVRISGRETVSRVTSGGWSPESNLVTLVVFLGTEVISELSVETAVGGRDHRVFTEFHWGPQTMILLLDHKGDDEGLLAPEALRFVVFKADDPVFRLDDAAIPAEKINGVVGDAMLWRVTPPWGSGRNTVSVEATATDGRRIRQEYSFVNLADGVLAYRQKAYVQCGYPGSRSGPIFRVESDGDAVALGAQSTAGIDALDSDGWLIPAESYFCEIVGAAAGEATLRIFEKPHFLQPEELRQEIRIRVSKGAKR